MLFCRLCVCLFVVLSFSAPQQSFSLVCLSGFPRVRREALKEVPSDKTRLEILEAIWSRQSHPTATAAARGSHRLRLEKDEKLAPLKVTISPEALTSGESGGAGRVPSETNGGCGVAAGGDFYREHGGIERPSREVDDDPMSRTSQSATGRDGTAGVSSAPCRRT